MFCVIFSINLTNKKYLAIVHAQLWALQLSFGQHKLLDAGPVKAPHHSLTAVQLRHPRPLGPGDEDGHQDEDEAGHGCHDLGDHDMQRSTGISELVTGDTTDS